MSPAESWECVRVAGQLEAEVLRAALETAGIPVVTEGEAYGRIVGLTVGPLGDVRIMVPADRLDEARELVDGSKPLNFPESD